MPQTDYWPTIIPAVHATHPELAFIAEVYWGMESTLHEQGFQLCYDKGLHDRLANGTAASIRKHLESDAPTRSASCASSRTTTRRARPRASARPRPRRRRDDVDARGRAPLS
jgi:hypothetical protein